MNLIGKFYGKNIYLYDPGIDYTEEDLRKLLSQFKRIEILRKISQCSVKLFNNKTRLEISGVLITNDVLLDLAKATIQYSSDTISVVIPEEAFIHLIKMCHKIYDKHLGPETTDPEEVIMALAYRQFIFQEKNFNLFARNYYLYKHLWKSVDNAKDFDILAEINSIIGVPLETCLAFTYSVLGNKNGYFWPSIYNTDTLNKFGKKLHHSISKEDFMNWLQWCSGDYDDILSVNQPINPFVLYPILNTRTKPQPDLEEVYIVISHQLLHNKVTSGLYYALMEKFNRGTQDNPFKERFGYVFQKYVGKLLSYYFKTWEVIPEIKYKKEHNVQQDTVDWFLLKQDRLLMIEVKQSSLFLKAKTTSKIDDISNDLTSTIVKAARQLQTSRKDIISKRYDELALFKDAKCIESMIVVNDPLYNANNIVKNLLKKNIPEIDFNIHIININDLEIMLSNQVESESFFDILADKSIKFPDYDFKEYNVMMFPPNDKAEITFLMPYFDEIFGEFLSDKENGAV